MFQLAHQSCQHAVDIAEPIEQRRPDFLFQIATQCGLAKLRGQAIALMYRQSIGGR